MIDPLVSVIIPVYNVSPYVEECLKSVMDQTYKRLEVIIVDDCGTDDSMEKVERMLQDYAGEISFSILHHDCNRGLSAARNTGSDACHGDFISFIDSDDAIAKDFYQKHLAVFDKDTAVSVCGAHYKRLKLESSEDVYIDPLRARKKHESKKAYILYLLTVDGRMYSSFNKISCSGLPYHKDLGFPELAEFSLIYRYIRLLILRVLCFSN